jgi:hypothetical protein
MQSIKQTVTIAGVLTTVFIPPVKAEERVIRTRTSVRVRLARTQ